MSRPNVLLISIDSLRRDYCSVYDETIGTMEFLEDFVETSRVFETAISPSTWTLPVHASVFTGLYPLEHRIHNEHNVLGDHETLAEILREAGYETKSFGHNGWLETGGVLRGFDHQRTHIPGMIGPGLDRISTGLRERSTDLVRSGGRQALESVPVKLKKLFFRHRMKGRRTVRNCIRELDSVDPPFCYFVHLNDVHSVFRPHMAYYRQFGGEGILDLHRNVRYQERVKDDELDLLSGDLDLSESAMEVARNLYRASILQVDELLETLIGHLEATGLADDTVVVVFGDHGELIGEGNRFGHALWIADEVIRVPLLVYDPTGSIPPGRERDIVQLTDVYPTVLDLTDQRIPETRSVPLGAPSRSHAYVHLLLSDAKSDKLERAEDHDVPPARQYALWRSPTEKLTYYPDSDEYVGPDSDDETLRSALERHLEEMESVPPRGEEGISDAVERNLREMGYL